LCGQISSIKVSNAHRVCIIMPDFFAKTLQPSQVKANLVPDGSIQVLSDFFAVSFTRELNSVKFLRSNFIQVLSHFFCLNSPTVFCRISS
jgi:hypothetical protein